MTLEFILIQLVGLIAWGILAVSYYREDTDKILAFQTIAAILYAVHYYFLGATSGLIICTFEAFRDFAYYKTDIDKYIFYASIPLYIAYGILSYKIVYDILPIFSSFLGSWSLTNHKKVIVFCAVIEYLLWIIYDLHVGSFTCAFTDAIIVFANASILLFSDKLFKDDEKLNNLFNK